MVLFNEVKPLTNFVQFLFGDLDGSSDKLLSLRFVDIDVDGV